MLTNEHTTRIDQSKGIKNHGGRIQELVLFLTTRCNLNCIHCNEVNNRTPIDLSINLLGQLLEQLPQHGIDKIALTGGEPCLHPEFRKVMNRIAEKNFYFSIVSNGYLYPQYIRLIRLYATLFKSITFSLDGANAASHDRLRGKGSFTRVCEAIQCFALLGRSPGVNICLHKKNASQLEAIGTLAVEMGATMLGWVTIDRSWNSELALTEAERKGVFARLTDLRQRLDVAFNLHPTLYEAYDSPPVHLCEMFDFSSPAIDSDGRVRFCCNLERSIPAVGNAHTDDLKKVFSHGATIAESLKANRFERIRKDNIDADFNTCDYCSNRLASSIAQIQNTSEIPNQASMKSTNIREEIAAINKYRQTHNMEE